MKKLILSVAVSVFAASLAPAAFAATTQQNKMKECNASATDKKGDERKAFMKECLSAKPAAKGTTQQEKMKSCNKDAGEKALLFDVPQRAFAERCLHIDQNFDLHAVLLSQPLNLGSSTPRTPSP